MKISSGCAFSARRRLSTGLSGRRWRRAARLGGGRMRGRCLGGVEDWRARGRCWGRGLCGRGRCRGGCGRCLGGAGRGRRWRCGRRARRRRRRRRRRRGATRRRSSRPRRSAPLLYQGPETGGDNQMTMLPAHEHGFRVTPSRQKHKSVNHADKNYSLNCKTLYGNFNKNSKRCPFIFAPINKLMNGMFAAFSRTHVRTRTYCEYDHGTGVCLLQAGEAASRNGSNSSSSSSESRVSDLRSESLRSAAERFRSAS